MCLSIKVCKYLGKLVPVALMLAMVFETTNADQSLSDGSRLEAVTFSALPGWRGDRHGDALVVFQRQCAKTKARRFEIACKAAKTAAARSDPRRFFEAHFRPYKIVTSTGEGFVTGYYEPVVSGSRQRRDRRQTALLQRPGDLVDIKKGASADQRLRGLRAARRTPKGLAPYPTRAEIEDGQLGANARPLVYVDDPVEAFFIHIQGSATIALAEGGTMRIAYAGRNGRPYTAIGRILIDRGLIARAAMSAERLKQWLRAHPEEGRAIMRMNEAYIFFRHADELSDQLGPVGAAGTQLTATRSLAIDPRHHPYGMPIFIAAKLPLREAGGLLPFNHLMIAQDTGTAIVGPARGDIFMGTGRDAGLIAGRFQHDAQFYVLLPRDMAP